MTLLRHDRESKRDLLLRLDRVEKRRSREEVEIEYTRASGSFDTSAGEQLSEAQQYRTALQWEDKIEQVHRDLESAKALKRLSRKLRFHSVTRKASKQAPLATDDLAEQIRGRRQRLLTMALDVLQLGAEGAVSRAKRDERRVVRELQDALKRDQKAYRNFSIFDHLKSQLDRAQKMLGILPVWILSPDDVARLFPCKPDLFDVVIVDEASQVDLPSIAPVAYRGQKLVIFGDTKQMQSQRFAFMSRNVALEAWSQFGMNRFDPVQRFHPTSTSLLGLAAIQAEEESLLDEHFRSLPPIIDFSNRRWYDSRLRIMTDVHHKRFGKPGQPIIELHHVQDGMISNDSQENEAEARALVEYLARLVKDPDYTGATIGVLCLFEEQVALVHDLVTDIIDPDEWDDHELVVVNPDGFQGDERDVILYSLSWDNNVMPRAALSARQQDSPHIQGMLNVAFTRARHEIHIFHSAPVDTFGMAGGQEGALGAWMAHCAGVHAGLDRRESPRVERVDSEFEAEVASALRARGVAVMHQYPACGFDIDLMCQLNGRRVAVECDGELYHKDEQGNLRIEDIERQAILERAGWLVLRIPYRKWLGDPDGQIDRVLSALGQVGPPDDEDQETQPAPGAAPRSGSQSRSVTKAQRVLIEALRSGLKGEEEVLRHAREALGHHRLGSKIRAALLASIRELNHLGLLVIEDGEYFLTASGRAASLVEVAPAAGRKSRARPRSRTYSRGRSRTRYRGRYYRY
jgi:very-short-patch-repair endonuclease